MRSQAAWQFDPFRWVFFSAYAAEMGDQEAKNNLLDYADRNFNPVWQNGEYYYPRNDDYGSMSMETFMALTSGREVHCFPWLA